MEANLTVAEVKDALVARGYNDADAIKNPLIDEAVYRLLADRRWKFLARRVEQAVTAGSSTIALTQNLARTIDGVVLRDSSGAKYALEYLDAVEFHDLETDGSIGTPDYWTFEDGTVLLWPIADKAYTAEVRYQSSVASVAGGATNLELPRAFKHAVVTGVASLLAYRQRDWSAVQIADQQFNTARRELATFHGIRQQQNAGRVAESHYWDDMR